VRQLDDVDRAPDDDGMIDTLPLDWSGHVPAPREPDEGAPPELDTPLARMALARARLRAAVALDAVTFVAACPACGQDCEWLQERQDTKVRSTIRCACDGRAVTAG